MTSATKLIVLLAAITTASCHQSKKNDPAPTTTTPTWEYISITAERSTRYILHAEDDTLRRQTKEHLHTPQKSMLTKSEKDSVVRWARAIVATPVTPQKNCTDYVGSLEVEIGMGQVVQQCRYSSICQWHTLSPDTQEIEKLLSKKFRK